MKQYAALVTTLLCLMQAAPAQALVAITPQAYSCTPDTFDLTVDDTGVLKLTGSLETPSPNFTYALTVDDNNAHVLTLTTPGDAQLAVIDNINIDNSIFNLDENGGLTVAIKKDFNWGPDKITCAPTNKGNDK